MDDFFDWELWKFHDAPPENILQKIQLLSVSFKGVITDEGLESDSTTIEGAFWRKSVWILMNTKKMKFTQNTWQTRC